MTTSYPGVYMREVSSGVRPIQAASTSVAAFVGAAERGPIGQPVRILNFTQFQTTFGDFLDHAYLAHAVFQFFNNGGSQCYVVRVAAGAVAAAATLVHEGDRPRHDALTLTASSEGELGQRPRGGRGRVDRGQGQRVRPRRLPRRPRASASRSSASPT